VEDPVYQEINTIYCGGPCMSGNKLQYIVEDPVYQEINTIYCGGPFISENEYNVLWKIL
jgi:hypothetical protein